MNGVSCWLEAHGSPSSFNPRNKLPDTRRDNSIRLQLVIPISNCPVAVSEKEIAVQICPDDANFLAVPPRCVKRPAIGIANEQGDSHSPPIVSKRPPLVESGMREIDWVEMFWHDG